MSRIFDAFAQPFRLHSANHTIGEFASKTFRNIDMSEAAFVEAVKRLTLALKIATVETKFRIVQHRLEALQRQATWEARQARARALETPRTGAALVRRLLERRHNPNWRSQPRVPRGNPDGGQWTDGGGGLGGPARQPTQQQVSRGPIGRAVNQRSPQTRPRDPIENQLRQEQPDDDFPLILVSDEIDPDEPPRIPKRRPPTARLRNAVVKRVASWLLGAVAKRALGPIGLLWDAYNVIDWIQEDRARIVAYADPPNSLEELQRAVADPQRGYDIHHIVERAAEKHGIDRALIDSPENLVRIPTLKHWEITGWYVTPNKRFGLKPNGKYKTPREYLRGKSWREHQRIGMEALRLFGVLKP